MVTITDVARAAGVSVSTVSHVLNGTRFVKAETRERVMSAIERLDYTPSTSAQSLKKNVTHTIGMIVTSSTNPYFAEVVSGVEASLYASGFNLMLCNSGRDIDKQRSYIRTLKGKRIDGLLVLESMISEEFLDLLASCPFPVVLMDNEAPALASVVDDSEHGGYLATAQLIAQGHRAIGCITGPADHHQSRQRYRGFQRALAEAGIELNPDWVYAGSMEADGGEAAIQALCRARRRPTALFAFNDLSALGAMGEARRQGLRVPEDLSIIGYDDIEIARLFSPSLTTVRQQAGVLCREASRLLTTAIADKKASVEHLEVAPELVVRDSVRTLSANR
ncbi:LacI family DNA-binding transcriptional regulator [Halomonas stenophila]|uniref:DNA-binding LacI/PurR family transcriptional regulator n=1 Tax=Halomonas stenophila TaxID=795312 RepID=A0A7W5HJP1_9GAMM|nr:LacI family DNA-binding transcriptional regulator [Halomonas stenophila]MBB3229224.1 DNA-binding LacI/PurR family transcriptional regulator [Halomonas stenophila]